MGTNLHNLRAPDGSRKKRKRVGRGPGSGLGKTSGKGHKGQKSRSGRMRIAGFEGGQMPLQRRLPKFGFKNPFRVEYVPVNLDRLDALFDDGATVDLEAWAAKGILKKKKHLVKVLGQGQLTKKLHVSAHAFSQKAKEAIENAGGSVTVIGAPAAEAAASEG